MVSGMQDPNSTEFLGSVISAWFAMLCWKGVTGYMMHCLGTLQITKPFVGKMQKKKNPNKQINKKPKPKTGFNTISISGE